MENRKYIYGLMQGIKHMFSPLSLAQLRPCSNIDSKLSKIDQKYLPAIKPGLGVQTAAIV